MKLALASSDFEENTITFLVPEPVMLDMGFYPCELEVGVEELMKHPPKKAEPAPAAPSEDSPLVSLAYLESRINLILRGKPVRDLDEAIEHLRSQLARKDEGREDGYAPIGWSWIGLGGHIAMGENNPFKHDSMEFQTKNGVRRLYIALREPDGRKGE